MKIATKSVENKKYTVNETKMGDKIKTQLIAFRMNSYGVNKLEEFAKKNGLTKTDIIRFALFNILRDKKDKDITLEDWKKLLLY